MTNKVVDIRFLRENNKNQNRTQKPDWTPKEIQEKIQPYIDFLNKPNKVFLSKKGDKWTEEENEQMKKLVFQYTCECYSCTAMAEEFKKYYPWRSTNSILAKISNIRQTCFDELEDFYLKVAYCSVIVKDAKMHYSAGKISFGSYLQQRMLQMAGLIPGPEEDKEKDSELDKMIKEANIIKEKALMLFKFNEKKRLQRNISYNEAAELLMLTEEELERVIKTRDIEVLNTKDLLDIALTLKGDLGECVRGLKEIFADPEKTKQWRRAERWREKRNQIESFL